MSETKERKNFVTLVAGYNGIINIKYESNPRWSVRKIFLKTLDLTTLCSTRRSVMIFLDLFLYTNVLD